MIGYDLLHRQKCPGDGINKLHLLLSMPSRKKIDYNRIKVVLAEKKKANKELAGHLKVTPQAVSRWCTNDSQPNIATLFAIAKFLQVKACWLLVED